MDFLESEGVPYQIPRELMVRGRETEAPVRNLSGAGSVQEE
jgi:hypothetical protein